MEDVLNVSKKFLSDVLSEIGRMDKLHAKTLSDEKPEDVSFFNYLCLEVFRLFMLNKMMPQEVAEDYMRMVKEMRKENAYFFRHGTYSCKSEEQAYEKFYSKGLVMSYYMNALLISQLLWLHHYKELKFFSDSLWTFFDKNERIRVLDVGAGHGLFSTIIMDTFVNYQKIDVIDVSKPSLRIAEKALGHDRIEYHNHTLEDHLKRSHISMEYDLVILGEVLEHMDNPLSALVTARMFLKKNGMVFVSIPINAPAVDHIYLFKSESEVYDLIQKAGLHAVADFLYNIKGSLTKLIGAFCIR